MLFENANPLQNYLINIGIQVADNKDMFLHLMDYWTAIHREKRMNVKQYVIFAGDKKPDMRTSVQVGEKGKFKFELIYLKAIDDAPFLASSIPEEVVLALLCRFPKGQGAPQVLQNILEKIKILYADDPENLKKNLVQLKIILKLRNLQKETSSNKKSHAALL